MWNGISINPLYRTMTDIRDAVNAWKPKDGYDAVSEWYPKAGEGGTWQAALSDTHPLALSGPQSLQKRVDDGKALGLRVVPYIVIRGRDAWNAAEWQQIADCARIAGKVILNLENGASYWNGPTTPAAVERWITSLLTLVSSGDLELCCIPRQSVITALGGNATMTMWLRYMDSASWEVYEDAPAPDLAPDKALPRVDAWAPNDDPKYRIPLYQRSMIQRYANSHWSQGGMQVWYLDGNI